MPKKTAKSTATNKKKPIKASPKPTNGKKTQTPSAQRILKPPKGIWYKPLTWRHRPPKPMYKPLPKARKLFVFSCKLLISNKKLFGGIVSVYGILNLILVRGLSTGSGLVTFKNSVDGVLHGVGGEIGSSTISFLYLLGTSGSTNSAATGIYQAILLIVCSLAFIWAMRQVVANNTTRIRDSFYGGMYPLVPFLLVLAIIALQLVPIVTGGTIFSLVISKGIAVHFWEKAFWFTLFVGLGVWTFRMITASIFALYIVTLPEMVPLRAIKSAKQLVKGRRLLILRKLIFLPFILLLLAAIIELPLILFLVVIAPWVFFILSTIVLALTHSYFYALYREML